MFKTTAVRIEPRHPNIFLVYSFEDSPHSYFTLSALNTVLVITVILSIFAIWASYYDEEDDEYSTDGKAEVQMIVPTSEATSARRQGALTDGKPVPVSERRASLLGGQYQNLYTVEV